MHKTWKTWTWQYSGDDKYLKTSDMATENIRKRPVFWDGPDRGTQTESPDEDKEKDKQETWKNGLMYSNYIH